METRIQIVDNMTSGVSNPANPNDDWDKDDTYESHNIQGIRVVGKKDFFDLVVGFKIEDGETYYLLYGIYNTGDSFSISKGRIQFVDLFESRQVAEENAKRLRKHNDDDSDNEDRWTASLVTEDGKEYGFHVPWKGYFERLQYLEVVPVQTGASRF